VDFADAQMCFVNRRVLVSEKSATGLAHSRTWPKFGQAFGNLRQLLECARSCAAFGQASGILVLVQAALGQVILVEAKIMAEFVEKSIAHIFAKKLFIAFAQIVNVFQIENDLLRNGA
jgi:hypothetical protein